MRAYQTVKNTGIAVITDCGELDNIHPTDKEPVGIRLALQALAGVYAQPVKAFGPIYQSYVLKNSGMELHFSHAENGFVVRGEPAGFELAGEDKNFSPAKAQICGNRIFISCEQVPEPKYARYNWFNYADVTIFNETGIPLAPFRTSMQDEK